jgi:hypothetical protein
MSSNQDRLRQCGGWVTTLRGHTVAYTGYVLIDGTRVPHAECAARAATRYAFARDDWSSAVTLLVHGDLAGKHVVNPEQGYSRKLLVGLCQVGARGGPVRRSHRGAGRLHTGQAPAQQASRTCSSPSSCHKLKPTPPDLGSGAAPGSGSRARPRPA